MSLVDWQELMPKTSADRTQIYANERLVKKCIIQGQSLSKGKVMVTQNITHDSVPYCRAKLQFFNHMSNSYPLRTFMGAAPRRLRI